MQRLYQAMLLVIFLASCEFAPARPPAAAPTPVSLTPPLAPTPTPVSAGVHYEHGLALRALGEYDAAAEQFHALIDRDPNDLLAPAAAFYLAESFVLRERWASAVAALEPIASADPPTLYAARALFLLARSYEASGDTVQAQAAYLRYAELATPIAPYAQLRRAELLLQQGQPHEAAALFEAAATSGIVAGERAYGYERAIAAQQVAQRPDEALRLYRALLELAQDPGYRARILLDAATLAENAGDPAAARTWRTEIIEQSPFAPLAQQAADQLLADPQNILDPEALAAIYSNAERWSDARTQFDAAIAQSTGASQLDLRRRQALTLREGESPDYAAAIAALDQLLVEAEPGSEVAVQTRLDRIQTLGQSGDLLAAVAGYRDFAAQLPNDPRAPEALRRAAVLLDRLNDPTAAETRATLARSYPESVQGRDALFPAGLGFYRAGRIDDAIKIWELQANQSAGALAVQGAYWAGRAHRESGNQAGAQTMLQRVILLAPQSYYAARAEDLLGSTRQGSVPLTDRLQEQDWAALTNWVGQWAAPRPADQPLPTLTALQSEAGPLARAQALDQVGLAQEARSEWRAVWRAAQDDPQLLVLIARIAYADQQTPVILDIIDRLFELAPVSARATAPPAFDRLDLPTPYVSAVLAATSEHQVQPLLLYGLLRQESRFDPQIVSVADARGLAQVMPATARGIAERLQVAAFREQDLIRPALNIRFGAFYLGAQLREFDGSWAAALAAYNGGPGNAVRWLNETSPTDLDLFVEGIDYNETRNYVKIVYSNYAAYQRLYRYP